MSGFYHGSRFRHFIGRTGFLLRQFMKRRSKPRLPDFLKKALAAYDTLVAQRDWQGLRQHVPEVVTLATTAGEDKIVQQMVQALERLGEYEQAAELRLRAHRPSKNYWAGEDLRGKSIVINLVEANPQSLGRVIRHLGLAGVATQGAERATIILEPRLHAIARRTFPNVQVAEPGSRVTADFYATFEDLQGVYGRDPARLASVFTPLRADPALTAAIRSRYLDGTEFPLIGLSWGSKSHTKDVPDFDEWNRFVNAVPGQFVSLQYGEISGALRMLRKGNARPLINDETIDQMVDMDGFAAQIAALDAVVTISNTAAHLAGALGVPTIFLIDDRFHTAWPVLSDRTPWYPTGIILRPDGRGWDAVLAETVERLKPLVAGEARPGVEDADGR